jgi:hypothetical protein
MVGIAMPPKADNPRLDPNFLGDRPGAAPVRRQKNYLRPLQVALQRHRRATTRLKYLAIFPRKVDFSCFGYHPDLESRLTIQEKCLLGKFGSPFSRKVRCPLTKLLERVQSRVAGHRCRDVVHECSERNHNLRVMDKIECPAKSTSLLMPTPSEPFHLPSRGLHAPNLYLRSRLLHRSFRTCTKVRDWPTSRRKIDVFGIAVNGSQRRKTRRAPRRFFRSC